mmetsp:Transcript_37984/g.89779  ORF Transcript_37984/g.89779 Transcript_37984/m.89779 type:complete len:381 (+) Transcript_37984:213-1355(+)
MHRSVDPGESSRSISPFSRGWSTLSDCVLDTAPVTSTNGASWSSVPAGLGRMPEVSRSNSIATAVFSNSIFATSVRSCSNSLLRYPCLASKTSASTPRELSRPLSDTASSPISVMREALVAFSEARVSCSSSRANIWDCKWSTFSCEEIMKPSVAACSLPSSTAVLAASLRLSDIESALSCSASSSALRASISALVLLSNRFFSSRSLAASSNWVWARESMWSVCPLFARTFCASCSTCTTARRVDLSVLRFCCRTDCVTSIASCTSVRVTRSDSQFRASFSALSKARLLSLSRTETSSRTRVSSDSTTDILRRTSLSCRWKNARCCARCVCMEMVEARDISSVLSVVDRCATRAVCFAWFLMMVALRTSQASAVLRIVV